MFIELSKVPLYICLKLFKNNRDGKKRIKKDFRTS